MMQTKIFGNLLILFLIGGFLISCSSQDQSPTNLSGTSVGNSTDSQEETVTVVEADSGNDQPLYTLNWKLDDGEIVAYRTAMNPAHDADSSISFNFDQLFTENDTSNDIRQQLSNIKLPETFSMISILEKNPQDNISVKMIVDEIGLSENESDNAINEGLNQLMGAMEGTVQLRGELTPDGAISSFYLEQNQRNLIAIFFELPIKPVQLGENWEIDVNCIAMGNGFIATNADQVNRVEFTGLTENDEGKAIAILDYLIAETVEGDFQTPFSDEVVPTSMTCTFLGQGLFLIEEGRWEQFTGEFAIKATGMLESDVIQHFALIPLENVPEEYIELR